MRGHFSSEEADSLSDTNRLSKYLTVYVSYHGHEADQDHGKDPDHPLLNVGVKMSVLDLTVKLTELAQMMEHCRVKIDETGKIIEQQPGALARVSARW